jgi:hypothetical protein
MDCKDLMVGDWIQVKRGFDGHLTNEKIKGLIDNDDESYPIMLATEETVSPNDIVPIKLTEDILVKNGYKSTQGLDFYWLDDKKYCCVKNYDGKRLFCYKQGINDIWLVVKYVHQLQHLLQLCGIEKELIID